MVDRFISLLLSLHDPTYYKNFTHASNNYFKELGITYNLKNKDGVHSLKCFHKIKNEEKYDYPLDGEKKILKFF